MIVKKVSAISFYKRDRIPVLFYGEKKSLHSFNFVNYKRGIYQHFFNIIDRELQNVNSS